MAEAASTAWHRLGTVSVTDGSMKVTGSGTRFLSAGINPGAAFRIDKRPYAWEIKNVVSDTELELAAPYYGGTVSNASYSIDRNHQSTLAADISARLALALGNWEARYDLDMRTITGKSAYEVAVEEGFKGTKAQWLESLKGAGEYPEIVSKVEPLTYNNAATHNSIYRGKNLGSTITVEQSAAIRNGTFEDLYPGDFWKAKIPAYSWTDSDGVVHQEEGTSYNLTWYILGCNAFFAKFDNYNIVNNHVVVWPFYSLFSEKMNDTAITEGGYVGSKMFTNHMLRAAAIVKAVFGEDHIQVHGDWLCNAVTNSVETGWAWFEDRVCDLMSEEMVFGRRVQSKESSFGRNGEHGRIQFPAFVFNPQLIQNGNGYIWLRDVVNSIEFAAISFNGGSSRVSADNHNHPLVNPFFLVH